MVESIDGSNTGELTVFLVHVVGSGARVVTDPDTEVLDLLGALLVDLWSVRLLSHYSAFDSTYLVDGDDLTVRLLDLAELAQEVPESRLGNDLVGRKDAHAVDLGGGVGL